MIHLKDFWKKPRGSYEVDDEGVRQQPVTLIDAGTLTIILSVGSRSAISCFEWT